jgi:trk system potassium uptake protein TrkH
MSGITATGATVLSGLDSMSPGILMWRSMLHWLGGIGFIGMAVAILPLLRIGGMRLFQTESSDRSEKVMPRSHMVARRSWRRTSASPSSAAWRSGGPG